MAGDRYGGGGGGGVEECTDGGARRERRKRRRKERSATSIFAGGGGERRSDLRCDRSRTFDGGRIGAGPGRLVRSDKTSDRRRRALTWKRKFRVWIRIGSSGSMFRRIEHHCRLIFWSFPNLLIKEKYEIFQIILGS